MDPNYALTCWLDLPGGRRVEVGMTVTCEPLFPTPGEPDVERAPALNEWADICGKLAMMQLSRIEITPPTSKY